MAKPKAPRWLTESFAQGIDERELVVFDASEAQCWLAQFDPAHKPCEGRFERFHFIKRQQIEAVVWWETSGAEHVVDGVPHFAFNRDEISDLIHVAAWDSRNGGLACEAHHRRLDSHLVPLPSEQLVVPYEALPEHVLEFASDYGLEEQLEAKYEPKGEA